MHTPLYRSLNKSTRSFGETEPLLLVDADASDSETASPVVHRALNDNAPIHVYHGLSPIATHQYDKSNCFLTSFFLYASPTLLGYGSNHIFSIFAFLHLTQLKIFDSFTLVC
jgi:hypothetical protein